MKKIQCEYCDNYIAMESSEKAFCQMLNTRIPINNEKTRCKYYAIHDCRFRCDFFRSWIETSQGEEHAVCLDEEKRTCRPCHCVKINHPETCPE